MHKRFRKIVCYLNKFLFLCKSSRQECLDRSHSSAALKSNFSKREIADTPYFMNHHHDHFEWNVRFFPGDEPVSRLRPDDKTDINYLLYSDPINPIMLLCHFHNTNHAGRGKIVIQYYCSTKFTDSRLEKYIHTGCSANCGNVWSNLVSITATFIWLQHAVQLRLHSVLMEFLDSI